MKHTPPPMRGTWTLIAPDGRKWEGDSPLRLAAAEQRERVPDQVAVQRVLDAASALRDEDRPKSLHELQDELYEFVTDDSERNGYWLHCEIVSKQNRLFDTLETLVDALTSGAGRDFIEAFVRDASAALESAQPGWNKVDEPTATEMRRVGQVRAAAPELLEALQGAKTVLELAVAAPDGKQYANLETRSGSFVCVTDVLIGIEAAIAKAEGRTA